MEFKSVNPYNGKEVGIHKEHSESELSEMLDTAGDSFKSWNKIPVYERSKLIRNAGQLLRDNTEDYARMITLEMGKPITESKAEINKCGWVCDYYADNAEGFLADEIIETDAQKSFVRHDPIGCVLAIMPWNFPFWQVFRFAAPTLTAGNTALLKHSSNVFGCAKMIEDVFIKAGFPNGVFQNLIVHHDKTDMIMKHDAVQAVSLTGSERAGTSVAQISGKYIKRSLLELGGSNSFIVWGDADIDAAVKTALTARMLNCGQSCIAAKRFILVENIYDEFVSKFIDAVGKLISGDPINEETQVGPLARKDLADDLHEQIIKSTEQGAELLLGGNQVDTYHEPTVLGNVKPGMTAFEEETFGPLAVMIKAKDEDDAFRLSELSRFGLGVTVCTTNIEKAVSMAGRVSDGAYFINELVKSDPRLPFGGTKISGYGRELAKDGMMEFVNRKTVYVK
ncbi:MAG: NAD-dependent succinate-semialdehyde dehydrogenase [Ignavibacteria bacterium]